MIRREEKNNSGLNRYIIIEICFNNNNDIRHAVAHVYFQLLKSVRLNQTIGINYIKLRNKVRVYEWHIHLWACVHAKKGISAFNVIQEHIMLTFRNKSTI